MNESENNSELHNLHTILASPEYLSGCNLFYVQIDERNISLTLGFEIADFDIPEGGICFEIIRNFRTQEEHNAVQFFLSFMNVKSLSVHGWEDPGQKKIEMTVSEKGHVSVSAESPGSSLHFKASSFTIPRVRSFRASQVF